MDSHFSTNDLLYGFSLYKWMNKEGHLSRWFVSRISMAYIYLVNKFHFFYCLGAYMSMCNCLKKYLLWICSVYCSSNDSRPNSMKKKLDVLVFFLQFWRLIYLGLDEIADRSGEDHAWVSLSVMIDEKLGFITASSVAAFCENETKPINFAMISIDLRCCKWFMNEGQHC